MTLIVPAASSDASVFTTLFLIAPTLAVVFL
jgi:hypothetical protein